MASVVGIIGGGGWLGGAIAERGLSAGFLGASSLIVSGRSPRAGKYDAWPDLTWTSENTELARRADIVILSVRPEQFGDLDLDLGGKLVVSVMAGIPMATLAKRTRSDRIIRAMPNAAAEIGLSYTPWIAAGSATQADRSFVAALFSCCGRQDQVETEAQLDYLSGFSGTGPAYPALLAKAMLQHALDHGIPQSVAINAVRGVIVDATQLMAGPAFEPAATVETFLAYRGVTAAGLSTMVARGLPTAVADGLDAAQRAASAMAERFGR